MTWRVRSRGGRRAGRVCGAARVPRWVGCPEVFDEDSDVQCEGARRRREEEGGATDSLREEAFGAMFTRD